MKYHKIRVKRKVVSAFGTIVFIVLTSISVDAQLVAEGEVKFKLLSEFFELAPAHGAYLDGQQVRFPDYSTYGILVKGDGAIVKLVVALKDNSDLITLNKVQDAVRKYEPISELAASVTEISAFELGPINRFVWYAPVGIFSNTGLQVADLSQAYGKHIRKLPRKYVLHVVGGRALRSWPSNISSALPQFPSDEALADFMRNIKIHAASPKAAHYILAFGDRNFKLRVAYLKARDALPFLWESYKAAGKPHQLGVLVAEAYWIATNSSGSNSGWLLITITMGIVGTALYFLIRFLSRIRRDA